MKNKKSQGSDWLLGMIIGIVVVVVVIIIVRGNLGAGASGLKQAGKSAEDCDRDLVANAVDKCPCYKGDIENNGCPLGYKITETGTSKEEDKACLADKKC